MLSKSRIPKKWGRFFPLILGKSRVIPSITQCSSLVSDSTGTLSAALLGRIMITGDHLHVSGSAADRSQ